MIEIIYKDEMPETKTENTVKTPKNIRQIGNGSSNKKIYIEDYVMSYLKRPPSAADAVKYGVLLGTMKRGGGFTYIFVNGVVEAPMTNREASFDDTTWAILYQDIKDYFGTLEIVGWFLSIPYKMKDELTKIQKVHLDNFAGNDKICFFNDRNENEDGFYIYESGRMNKQPGYYIYYDRNENMQKYFINKNLHKEPHTEIVRQTEGSFRSIMNEKTRTANTYNSRLAKAGAMVAVVAVLVTAISTLSNYGDIKSINGAINTLTAIVLNRGTEEETTKDTVIEVVGNNISPTTKEGESSSESDTDETDETTAEPEATTKPKEANTKEPEADTESNKPASANDVSYYTVKEGETLFQICIKIYNDSNMLEKLREVNGLDENYTIKKGQKLILP